MRHEVKNSSLISDLEARQLHRQLASSATKRELSHAEALNLQLLDIDFGAIALKKKKARIAIVSLLFNWPSTGGGIVHTAELATFLSKAGYEVRHFYAVFESCRSAAFGKIAL